ncbi:MAG: ChaN family lipoprotein [Bdellovibrionaceae bacterium]|nr:ChaN family lipoprotein [Pseudobdellovibrionaceae bacterium]NUM58295.1 ChaN family lipoprotein [Pseudobdellovibrionaceae bacterium]
MLNFISILVTAFYFSQSFSEPLGLYNGQTGEKTKLAELLSAVRPGDVLLLGEKHANSMAQEQQMQILQGLRDRGLKVSVAMEFFYYPHQELVDQFKQGLLSEDTFLQQSEWGSLSFEFYKSQALFPRNNQNERTLAINAPRKLTNKVAKKGLSFLDAEEVKLLPPALELGNESYRKRYMAVAPHMSGSSIVVDNYFAAQSIWDDTMAWQIAKFTAQNTEQQVLVVVVGEFHVAYGGGLPDRLYHRGVLNVKTLTQLDHTDFSSEEELVDAIVPSHEFGIRSDYIWIF